ncbi:MAG: hypothetical protein LBR92_00515 [Puniceicoccales bacterium]|jgi:hypothetical protein|nr:hypothetical protein [Puniceicoccales bacterium]
MNIISDKSKNVKLVNIMVIGSLFSGTLLNATLKPFTKDQIKHRDKLIEMCFEDKLTADIIEKLSPEEFGSIGYVHTYGEIFSKDKTRKVITSEQIAAVDPIYADAMNISKLSTKQLKGVTVEQLKNVGQGDTRDDYRWKVFKKVKRIEDKLNPQQKEALKIAEKRIKEILKDK